MRLSLKVVPNSTAFSVKFVDGILKVRLSERAEKGRANLELAKQLTRFFGKEVRIISGMASRKKIIEVEGSEEEILKLIESKAGSETS